MVLRPPDRLTSALTSLLALLLVAAVVLVSVLPLGQPPPSLLGPWEGQFTPPGGETRPVTVTLPSSFRAQGLDPDGVLEVHRTVTVPPSATPYAVHFTSVRHALTVSWDGEPVGSWGHPESTEGPRHEGSAIAYLPADPDGGPHELALHVRGDLHRGGLTGQIRLGPLPQVHRTLLWETGGRLGFALAFALVGVVHILGTARHAHRRMQLLFGLFTLSLAGYAFEHSAGGLLWSTHPYPHHALRRLFVSGMLGFALTFVTQFVDDHIPPWARRMAGFLAVVAVMSWLGPWWSSLAEALQDGFGMLVIAPWMVVVLLRGARRRIHGAGWLAAAIVVATAGGLAEALVTHGFISGARWMYPALSMFLMLGSVAVAQQDRALSDRHRRLVTGSEDAMIEVDTDGRVRELNPAAKAFFPGLAPGRIVGDLVPEDSRPLMAAHLARAGTAPTRCEFLLRDDRAVESVATPLDTDTRLLVLRDVTRRRRAEDDLLTAARVETAGQLLGGIAHDFNNLLSALLGHVGLLRLTGDHEARFARLDRMEEAIERASGITRRLLAVGGRTHTEIVQLSARELLDEVREMADPALPAGIELTVQADDVSFRTSAEDLRHVLLNLILNARDAVDGRGQIEVRAHVHDQTMRLEVEDSGPGVPLALRERIWDPFFTTKGPERGTGLGLPTARRLVRQHGGTIDFVDGCFRIEVPIGTVDESPITHFDGARIAVVDDEEALRTSFAAALRAAGYAATVHEDATSALPALAAEPPDVLVTDVVMPGMSGLELATALRELQPELPVVVVSGFVPATEQLLRHGPTEQLDKPVRPQRVVDAVARLLTEKHSEDAAVVHL